MTVGEKLQYYRKKEKMSQEELGQKLLVSRQTISLWETGQTLPTIDNLIKLKEIFKVSVDELLCEEVDEEISEVVPKESYTFQYSQEDLKQICKSVVGEKFKKVLIWSVIFICWIVLGFTSTDTDYGFMCFLFGIILTKFILYYRSWRMYKKLWKKRLVVLAKNEYTYNVYDDHILLQIKRNGEKVRESIIHYSAIDKVYNQQDLYVFEYEGQSFTINKSNLDADSLLHEEFARIRNASKKKDPTKAVGIWNTISIVLFVASLLSVFIAADFVFATTPQTSIKPDMWKFFLFLPIPLASLVLGIVFKKKGWKSNKNIVVGIVISIILCGFGSFSFVFAAVYDYSPAYIQTIEEYTGIDIPEHISIATQEWTIGTQSIEREFIYYTSEINFDDDAVKEFEEQLSEDERWLSPVPNELVGLLSSLNYNIISEYTLLYNTETEEFNTAPSEDGTYRFISIFYSSVRNEMRIVEYDIDYVA